MIDGYKTTPAGLKVLTDDLHPDAAAQQLGVMDRWVLGAGYTKNPYASWYEVMRSFEIMKVEFDTTKVVQSVLKLEKLGYVDVSRPPLKVQNGHHTAWRFDKEGKHHWVK